MLFGACSTCVRLPQGDCTCKQLINSSRSPRVSPHYYFPGGVKFPQGEESAVIYCMKNYLFYEDATCYNLCDFNDVTAFSSLFFLALHYCFLFYIFFLLWLFLSLFLIYIVFFLRSSFSWLCCSFSRAPFSPECCFYWLFLWPLLPSSS